MDLSKDKLKPDKPHDFHGKIDGFSVFFPVKPIHFSRLAAFAQEMERATEAEAIEMAIQMDLS